jgi:hypothetical protein
MCKHGAMFKSTYVLLGLAAWFCYVFGGGGLLHVDMFAHNKSCVAGQIRGAAPTARDWCSSQKGPPLAAEAASN